jgi:formyltetrahydrofolate synthetase
LKSSTATSLNYGIHAGPVTDVTFGNKGVVTTEVVTELGHYSALVLPDKDLDEDLVSTNPFLEDGFNLTMTAQGCKLWHPETGEEIGV